MGREKLSPRRAVRRIQRALGIGSVKRKVLRDLYPQHDIGEHSYGSPEILEWGEGSRLVIGKYCSIASGVLILLGGEHRADWATTYPFPTAWDVARQYSGHPQSKGDVSIGNDVWIGARTIILSGITIGDGACIGAGSVVTSDVPAYTIAAGNPCHRLRDRFPKDLVARLEHVAWWDWDEATIERALPWLLSSDIEVFLDFADQSPATNE